MSVVVLIEYRALHGQEEAAERALRDVIATVLEKEPDCAGIELLRDADGAGRWLLVEHWTSREAYLGPHLQQPHLRAFIERAGALFAGPPDIAFWSAAGGA